MHQSGKILVEVRDSFNVHHHLKRLIGILIKTLIIPEAPNTKPSIIKNS
jgi:hypothetical protein